MATRNEFELSLGPIPETLSEGKQQAILRMYANDNSVEDLAQWYRVTPKQIRAVLQARIQFVKG
jgi:hypothetical protein